MALRDGYQDFIVFLNEVRKLDPEWIDKLLHIRVECNESIINHPSIQGGYMKDGKWCKPDEAGAVPVAGLLGLINGFYGTFDEEGPRKGCGPVASVFDDNDDHLMGFTEFGASFKED